MSNKITAEDILNKHTLHVSTHPSRKQALAAMEEYRSLSAGGMRGWTKEKPEFTEECLLITASHYTRNNEPIVWNFSVWQIKKLDGEDDAGNPAWYWGWLNGEGEEYGDLADLHAQMYLVLPLNPDESISTLHDERRKIVCYCGSLRVAIDAFKKAEYEAVLKGEIALLPCCMFVDIEREYGAESDYKQKADDLHKRKIDICDEVFVLNVGGYIGQSTRSEIEYAQYIGKPINYLEYQQP